MWRYGLRPISSSSAPWLSWISDAAATLNRMPRSLLFSLFVDGNLVEEFGTRDEADAALAEILEVEPHLAESSGVVEYRDGQRQASVRVRTSTPRPSLRQSVLVGLADEAERHTASTSSCPVAAARRSFRAGQSGFTP